MSKQIHVHNRTYIYLYRGHCQLAPSWYRRLRVLHARRDGGHVVAQTFPAGQPHCTQIIWQGETREGREEEGGKVGRGRRETENISVCCTI